MLIAHGVTKLETSPHRQLRIEMHQIIKMNDHNVANVDPGDNSCAILRAPLKYVSIVDMGSTVQRNGKLRSAHGPLTEPAFLRLPLIHLKMINFGQRETLLPYRIFAVP
jgi:hypothetical protein